MRPPEFHGDHVHQNLLQGHPVPLVHGEQESRHHQDHHSHHRIAVPDQVPGQEIEREADGRGCGEADDLPLRQVECHLVFYFGQVLRDTDICHSASPL